MSVAWTLTRERIADKAMEKCRRLAAGQTPSSEDRNLCLEALDGILKELPLFGYSWPKVGETQASLTLAAATSPTDIPTLFPDFFNGQNPHITYLDASGNEKALEMLTLARWQAIPRKTEAAEYPIYGYISPDGKLWTYPVQNQNVSARMFYQQVVDDTVGGQPPDVSQPWILGLVYGVAAEVGDEFGVGDSDKMRFEAKWAERRIRGMNALQNRAPLTVEVDD